MFWKHTVSAEFRPNCLKLCGNCAFPQNFHPRKLDEPQHFMQWTNIDTMSNQTYENSLKLNNLLKLSISCDFSRFLDSRLLILKSGNRNIGLRMENCRGSGPILVDIEQKTSWSSCPNIMSIQFSSCIHWDRSRTGHILQRLLPRNL